MIKIVIPVLSLLFTVGCLVDNDPGSPDAETAVESDAAPLPRCADVGCPEVAFCTADGCCSCLATGEPVQCLSAIAENDACAP